MMPCALKKISWGPAAGETKEADAKNDEVVSPTKCLKEVGLLRSLQHPNVVLYLDSFLHEKDLYIVLEWAGKGDLKGLISEYRRRNVCLSEGGVWSLFSQCCEAVRHMHEKRIIHRDIKPSNVFIMEDGSLKLGDLGLGRYLDLQSILAFSQVRVPHFEEP
jgi:NIMA (never in mitosis gene a)-related kinase